MGTRSTIALLRNDGTVAQVYCHWDGYLEHNGQILFDHYNTVEKIEELLSYGDVSSLGERIGQRHPFDTYNPSELTPEDLELVNRSESENWCKFYGRDRNKDDAYTLSRTYASLEEYENKCDFEEYNYVFMHGVWTYCTYDTRPRLLEDGLKEVNKEAA